jgi:hypothetical protein
MAEGPATNGRKAGILWGCIAPVLIVILIVAGWFTYNTYYYTAGYKEAPGLPTVMTAVRNSPLAAEMLGSNIEIERMELNMPSNARQNGRRIFYKVRVKGSRGEGEVQTSVLLSGDKTRITSLKLIGEDDVPRNLLPEAAQAP